MKKILLIEDNIEMRENTAEILELASYDVLRAENGKQGVDLALKYSPDLIICDIMMPVMDGYGVFHLLSKNEATQNTPFIFLSAKTERSDVRRGMELGVDDYLCKPFDDGELLAAVETRLRKSENMRTNYARTIEGLNALITDAQALDDLSSLSANREARHYRKNEQVYAEGAVPHGVFFLESGKVKTFRTHEQGKELITGLYSPGNFFGYLSLMEETPYADAAQTLDESKICFIPKDDFFSLLLKNSEVSRQFIRLLADELEQREEQLLHLAYNSVRKRVAEALLNLEEHYRQSDDQSFKMSISRENLANLAGTATETTIRTLSDFKDERLIEISGSNIRILNRQKLLNMRN